MVGLEFQGHDFVGLRIGVVRSSNKFDIKAFVKSEICAEQIAALPFTNLPHVSWWLYKKDSKGSLWNRIIDEGQDNVLKECEDEIMLQIKTFMDVCNCSANIS